MTDASAGQPTCEPRGEDPGARLVPDPGAAGPRLRAVAERAATLEREGRWDQAAEVYEELFRRAVEWEEEAWMVDAVRWRARVRGQQRLWDEAEELADLSRMIAQGHGLEKGSARATNLLAMFRHDQGDLDGAYPLYREALSQAREAGDDQLIGFICQNMGVHANMRGDLRGARVLYLESIAATLASEDETNVTMAYNNLGMVCTDLEEWLEAEVYFDRGIEVARRLGDMNQLARLCANKAEPLLLSGETVRARAALEQAEQYATGLQARSTHATIACLRALAARLEGELAEAESHVLQALAMAREGKMLLSEAEAQEELARVRRDQGQLAEACAEAVTAQELFRQIGASRDVARLTLLLKELESAESGAG